MPTLQERFADLAEEAPDTPTPPGIWVEGRRRARARRVGTTVVVAATLVLVAAVGGFAAHESRSPGYADTEGAAPALPSTIYEPSRWLSTSDGPPGPLSMVIPAKRGTWTGYRWGIVGVSATTGAYHFLDLPDFGSSGELSPDGRHVAYWLKATRAGRVVLDGIAVYDNITGKVVRWVPSPGRPVGVGALAWNGSDALTFRAHRTSYLWKITQPAPRPVGHDFSTQVGFAGAAGLYQSGIRSYFYLDPRRSRRVERVTIAQAPHVMATPRVVSPSGRRIAIVHATQRHSQLLVGRVGRSGAPAPLEVLNTPWHWPSLVGWTDDRHLMGVTQLSPTSFYGEGANGTTYALERFDVRTGQVASVIGMGHLSGLDVGFATDLLSRPTHDFAAPPEPMDPRLELGLVVAVVVVGGVALVVWRRHARA